VTDPATPLLLHSLSTFGGCIVRCLEIAQARLIVEIGSETGVLTLELVSWAAEHEATVVSVDPEPPQRVLERAAETEALVVVAGASPEALADVEPADVYIIDGDHNHSCVSRELAYIFGDPQRMPLAILHDVGWPCARRDAYYAPERLPEGATHPYSYDKGAVPGRSELVHGGFRGVGQFAFAEHEGGERNGVLTAVEDFLKEREDLRLVTLPAVFGVAFVWSTRAPFAAALEAELGPLDRDPLLEALERNRIALYIRTIELQDLVGATSSRADRVIAELDERIGALEAENARLLFTAAEVTRGEA